MRKLVSIQEIKDVKPIENADKIEVVKVLGWNRVQVLQDRLTKFKGVKCVYSEKLLYLMFH